MLPSQTNEASILFITTVNYYSSYLELIFYMENKAYEIIVCSRFIDSDPSAAFCNAKAPKQRLKYWLRILPLILITPCSKTLWM